MFSQIKSPYGKLFFCVKALYEQNLITLAQKGLLKDLLIEEANVFTPVLDSLNVNIDIKSSKELESFLISLINEKSCILMKEPFFNSKEMIDDSIIENSVISVEAKLIDIKRKDMEASIQSMKSSFKGNELKEDKEEEEEDEEMQEEGSFKDYYQIIGEEYNLPALNELSRIESSQIFMTRSSAKQKN